MQETLKIFSPRHAKLAEFHGVDSSQIRIVASRDELIDAARTLGDLKPHGEGVVGLCIRPEGTESFPDPQIIIRWPVPEGIHRRTYERLDPIFPFEALNYLDQTKPGWLLAFLILHEIAHYKLGHTEQGDHTAKEREADAWAHRQLVSRYAEFRQS